MSLIETTSVEQLFTALFGGQDGYIELRAIPGKQRAFIRPVDVAVVEQFITKNLNQNIFFGVAVRRDSSNGRLENCSSVRTLFADLDFKDFNSQETAQQALDAFPMSPSIVVHSGNGLHAYWLLDQAVDLQQDHAAFRSLLRRLAFALGADLQAAEPARVLRIPSTLNHKSDPPKNVSLVSCDDEQAYSIKEFDKLLPPEPKRTESPLLVSSNGAELSDSERRRQAGAYARKIPGAVTGQHGDIDTFRAACKVLRGFDLSEADCFDVLRTEYNPRCNPPWTDRELQDKIQSAERNGHEPVGGRLNGDRLVGRNRSSVNEGSERGHSEGGDRNSPIDLLTQGLHDTGNAYRIQLLYGDALRYCEELRKYIFYDGRMWTSDSTGKVKKMAKATMLEFLRQAFDKGGERVETFARSSLNANRIKAALELLQCEVPIRAGDLDTNPWLLNFENGTYDLKAGELRKHRPKDYVTKIIPFPFNPEAKCERFQAFLHQIMGATENSGLGELERAERLAQYLQKIFGYSITGDVSEKAVFCFFGPTDAGKTTLLESIRYPLAEYSHQILIESLMVHHRQETNNSMADLADLKGARFVTTSEGEDGQRLAQGKLKYLSAGMGKIKTCRKYENPITFEATHKLFLDSNYKPVVKGDDDAVWNRLKPIPFTVSIPKDEIDRGLIEKLQTEAEGILAWLVDGCRLWQKEGLDQPEEVQAANISWRSEMDPLPDFLADRCEIGEDAVVQVTEFRKAYEAWADDNGDREFLKRPEFIRRMERAGFKRIQDRIDGKTQRLWKGLNLKEKQR